MERAERAGLNSRETRSEIAKVCSVSPSFRDNGSRFRNDGRGRRIALQTTVSTFAWIAREQLLTFPGPNAISTPPGSLSGLLAFALEPKT
jgi:hypothetical protein